MKMKKAISYDDVLLIPQFSNIRSRKEIDLTSDLGKNLKLKVPIISSPMDTVTESMMAGSMSYLGGLGIIHRYCSIEKQVSLIEQSLDNYNIVDRIGFAVGVGEDMLERAGKCLNAGATVICIDVAHGHHINVKDALLELREAFGYNVHIMAGNVATIEGINYLADWGANSVRCNIGGGSICSTRIQTGHGYPGLQTIMECSKTDRNVTIIADGGIRNAGDIVKALAAGADAVMIGSLLSGTKETPGAVYTDVNGIKYKTYRGMASKEAQVQWRGNYSSFEGISSKVPYRGKVENIIQDLERGVRSGLSYSGARTIRELQSKATWVRQTTASLSESKTHITTRKW